MAAVSELIRVEDDGTLSFGDYTKKEKTKKSDFKANGGIYKVKTFNEITRLECDDEFVFESDPGTAVFHFLSKDDGVSFEVEGPEDADITVGLEPGKIRYRHQWHRFRQDEDKSRRKAHDFC